MASHRTFSADRFLDKFQGFEGILQKFVALWAKQIDLNVQSLTIAKFKKWLVEDKGDSREELLEALYQVYDLCTDKGHEGLVAACQDSSYNPDPDHSLPVECLSMKVRTEREDVFALAYDRYKFYRAERFSIFRGRKAKPIDKPRKNIKKLNALLSKAFYAHKGTDRILVRPYVEGSLVNFVVYHEKRVKITLTLKGSKGRTKVHATIFRPAQQDFLSYNQETGQLDIEAGFQNEEKKLRQCFAEAYFDGDADFFDGPHAAEIFGLGVIANSSFTLNCSTGVSATLVGLRFELPQSEEPKFEIRGKNVIKTLAKNGLLSKLESELISGAIVKITFPGDLRGKRVEVTGSNGIKFNRAKNAEEVFSLLKDWGILLSKEFHADADELLDAQASFVGDADDPA